MALTQTQVSQLYVSVFGRASEGEGNTYWQTDQADMTSTAAVMLDTDAAKEYFGSNLDDNQAFIEHIYENTLGKTIADDADGIAYWVSELEAGKSKAEVIVALIDAAKSAANAGDAQDQFNNRVEVSNYTADTLAKFTTTAEFAGYIDDVDESSASVTAAKAEVDNDVPGVEGNTYMLTSGTDRGADFTGTADNDTFDAPIVQNSFAGGVSNSLSSADKLDGGAGIDTLNAELVQEFFGVTGENQIDVQPTTANIEKATFEARDVANGDAGNGIITLDAKKMTDIDEIGSKFSDGDLVIENLTTLESNGNIRNTEAITITMDHTDNFDSDGDASDLTVLFDEDYLLSGQAKTTSQANYWLLDEDSQDYTNAPLLNIERDGVTLTIDGVAYEIRMDNAVAKAADTWAAFADALQDRIEEMIAEGNTALEGLAVTVDTTNNDQTYNDFGNLVTIPAISIVDSQGRDLVPTGFTSPEEATGAFDIYGRFDSQASQVSDQPITVNIDLEKVGRDGEGGNLIVGGKDLNSNGDTDVDQADGIEVFNIDVLGDDDKPSNLGFISSTNNELDTVKISTHADYAGSGDVADLTVRDQLGAGQELTLINATSFEGDFRLAENGAQQVITANFGGGNDFMNWMSNEADGVSSGKAYSLSMGSGDDTLNANLDGDSVDTIGESFSIATGSGADTVTLNMADGVSQQTMEVLDHLSMAATNSHYLSISTANGADTVNLNGYGNFHIDAGDDSDFVYVNSQGTAGASTGSWAYSTTTGAATFVDRVLYEAKLTVTFAGFESTVTVDTDASGNFVADQITINNAIKEAIAGNPELKRLLVTSDGTGEQQLTITSTVDGANQLSIDLFQPELIATGTPATGQVLMNSADEALLLAGIVATDNGEDSATNVLTYLNAIQGSLNQDGTVGLAGTGAQFTEAFQGDSTGTVIASSDATGASNVNYSSIDMGNGANDLVVLDSNDDSANILVIDQNFGKVSVVNFFDDAALTVVGNHAIDFTSYLDNDTSATDSALSAKDIAVTLNADATAEANSVTLLRMDGTDTETFATLSATDLITALNGDGTADDNYADITNTSLSAVANTTNLVNNVQDHIVMVENADNLGEYRVFYLTSTVDTTTGTTDGEFDTSAVLLGTLDFGNSINFQLVGSSTWDALYKGLQVAADGGTPVIPNNPPVAVNDDALVAQTNVAANLNVLANDSDVDGDTIVFDTTSGITVTGPTGATATAAYDTVNKDIDFTADTAGTYTFEYKISDGEGGTATATATVTVSDSPVPTYDETITVADLQTYDATTGNNAYVADMGTGVQIANINGFAAGDSIDIDEATYTTADYSITTTGTTEINFIFGDLSDYTPSWLLNLGDVDATVVADVAAAADTVAKLGVLDAAFGDFII